MMTRSQALILSVLTGFVVLACLGMVMLLLLPSTQLFSPVPTSTLLPPTGTLLPDLPPVSLPTRGPATDTPEPTVTNTRVPTLTPTPVRTPTPTVVIKLVYPVKPSDTPTPVEVIPPTITPTPPPEDTPVPMPRSYNVSFTVEDTTVIKEECTYLRWRVEGASAVALDDESVAFSDKKKVCPKKDASYRLVVQLPDSTELIIRTIQISVEEEEDNDNTD